MKSTLWEKTGDRTGVRRKGISQARVNKLMMKKQKKKNKSAN